MQDGRATPASILALMHRFAVIGSGTLAA